MSLSNVGTDRPLPPSFPTRTTLRELLTSHLDIFSVPRRSFFEFLSHFTTDELETEKLREFASSEGQVRLSALLLSRSTESNSRTGGSLGLCESTEKDYRGSA